MTRSSDLRRPQRIDVAIAETVARCPEGTALAFGGQTLDYRALDERADRIAAGLLTLGTQPGDRIGVCLKRSLDLVVTLLAVLKADAVYVPMDPGHPTDRLAYTVQDAALRIVVTNVPFPETPGIRNVRPSDLVSPGRPPKPVRGPDEAAYVIYTSGSTGRPKGVEVPHQNVLALVNGTRNDFALTPDDTWVLFHSSAFDVSVWEMWGALLTGARLVIPPYWVCRSPEDFHALLVAEQVTILGQTPSAFPQLMAVDHDDRLAVRLLIFAGEPLDARMLRGWFDRYPEDRCRVVNMYGITETTVHSTIQTITAQAAASGSRSVGGPIPGWTLYVLDAQRRPVAPGETGEIYVGGAGVALGYLDRPDLTAERFLPDPYHGGRMYRSGDAGRLLPDGTVEHRGRLDNQVKVRGFRVELDEIRNVLLDGPAIVAAAVILRNEHDAAIARLDAYLVLNGNEGPDWQEDLQARAAKLLPDYMVPTTFTAVPELPRTVNGKLDVVRLPSLSVVRLPRDTAAVDDLTTAMTEAWESVLGVDVGPDDNFFSLGGNSLIAVRVRSAMRSRGVPPIGVRQLYVTPTIRKLIAAIRSKGLEPMNKTSGS